MEEIMYNKELKEPYNAYIKKAYVRLVFFFFFLSNLRLKRNELDDEILWMGLDS